MGNLERQGIIEFHFPDVESHEKSWKITFHSSQHDHIKFHEVDSLIFVTLREIASLFQRLL